LAFDSARGTPSASWSVVQTGVPGCWRQDPSRAPASTASKSELVNQLHDHRFS